MHVPMRNTPGAIAAVNGANGYGEAAAIEAQAHIARQRFSTLQRQLSAPRTPTAQPAAHGAKAANPFADCLGCFAPPPAPAPTRKRWSVNGGADERLVDHSLHAAPGGLAVYTACSTSTNDLGGVSSPRAFPSSEYGGGGSSPRKSASPSGNGVGERLHALHDKKLDKFNLIRQTSLKNAIEEAEASHRERDRPEVEPKPWTSASRSLTRSTSGTTFGVSARSTPWLEVPQGVKPRVGFEGSRAASRSMGLVRVGDRWVDEREVSSFASAISPPSSPRKGEAAGTPDKASRSPSKHTPPSPVRLVPAPPAISTPPKPSLGSPRRPSLGSPPKPSLGSPPKGVGPPGVSAAGQAQLRARVAAAAEPGPGQYPLPGAFAEVEQKHSAAGSWARGNAGSRFALPSQSSMSKLDRSHPSPNAYSPKSSFCSSLPRSMSSKGE